VTMTVLLTNIMNWTNDRKKTAGEIRRCLGVFLDSSDPCYLFLFVLLSRLCIFFFSLGSICIGAFFFWRDMWFFDEANWAFWARESYGIFLVECVFLMKEFYCSFDILFWRYWANVIPPFKHMLSSNMHICPP
jgi:hypothetical protein